MAASADTTSRLDLAPRVADGSRSARRLRRTGQVPGIIYGGGGEPVLFTVDGRILRNTLARSGAILEVAVGDGETAPVLVKDLQRHPVRGHAVHLDLLRVDMKVAIHTHVTLELTGADNAPGVIEGGVLSQGAVEINIEALPGDIPDALHFDVSGMEMNDTITLSQLVAPPGVTLLDDPHETVLATLTPPTKEPEPDEIETETGVVGEDGEGEAGAGAEGDTGEAAEQSASSES